MASVADLERRRLRVPEHVAHRVVGDETVLLNVATSTYHSVDAVGTRFFDRAREAPTLAVACAELAEEYEQPPERIAADLREFVDDLLERDLIALEPVEPGAPPA